MRDAIRVYGLPLPEEVVAACNTLTRAEWERLSRASRVGYWRAQSGLEREAARRAAAVRDRVARALAAGEGGAR